MDLPRIEEQIWREGFLAGYLYAGDAFEDSPDTYVDVTDGVVGWSKFQIESLPEIGEEDDDE